MEKQFVSETLTENVVESFVNGIPVLLTAGTGCGKSHWIKTVLIPYYLKIGKRMVFFHNRYAQGMQNEFDVKELQDNNLLLVSYQKLEKAIENNIIARSQKRIFPETEELLMQIECSDVFIIDEAQYFITDSTFNTHTQDCFDFIQNLITLKVSIFMTATPAGLYQHIKYDLNMTVKEYVFKDDYSHINKIVMFSDKTFSEEDEVDRQLNKIIKTGIERGKVFIAVDNKELGYNIYSRYKSIAAFMCAQDRKYSKDSLCNRAYEKIVKEDGEESELEKIGTYTDNRMIEMLETCVYPKDITILVTTQVMETGFNIKDKDVKTVIIMNRDMVTTKQLAGRIRGIGIEKHIDMYIWAANAQTLDQSLKELLVVKREVERVEKGTFKVYNRYQSKGIYTYFTLDLEIKPLAKLNLIRRIKYLQELVADEDGFKIKTLGRHILEQFGIKPSYYGAPQLKTTQEQRIAILEEVSKIAKIDKKGNVVSMGEMVSATKIKQFMEMLNLMKCRKYNDNKVLFAPITKWQDVAKVEIDKETSIVGPEENQIRELGYRITGKVNSKNKPIIKIEKLEDSNE